MPMSGQNPLIFGGATTEQGAKADTALQPSALFTQTAVANATAAGIALLGAANAAAQRTLLGVSATGLQPGAALTQTAVTNTTAAGVTLLTAADAAAQRTALGLGTAATTATTAYATSAQGGKAETALQPGAALTQAAVTAATAAGVTLLSAADAAAQRTALDFNAAVDARVPVASAAAPQPNAQTAAVGVSTTYARADHAHKEALTTLGYDALTKTLTYKDEAGINTTLDLSALAVDLRVDGASISGTNLTLRVNDSGTATDILVDLSTLKTVGTGGSITGDGNTFTVQLVNDILAPGNSRYYGTSDTGVKGFHVLPVTNLSNTPTATTVTVGSSTGTGTDLPAATATTAGLMLPAQFTKLDGVAAGATANSTDAVLLDRANHTGTTTTASLSDFNTAVDARIGSAGIDALADVTVTTPTVGQVLKWNGTAWVNGTDETGVGGNGVAATNLGYTASATNGVVVSDTGTDATIPAVDLANAGLMLPAQAIKLDGVQAGATANSTDTVLLERANHTGTQLAATISDFNTGVDGRIASATNIGTTAVSAINIGNQASGGNNILVRTQGNGRIDIGDNSAHTGLITIGGGFSSIVRLGAAPTSVTKRVEVGGASNGDGVTIIASGSGGIEIGLGRASGTPIQIGPTSLTATTSTTIRSGSGGISMVPTNGNAPTTLDSAGSGSLSLSATARPPARSPSALAPRLARSPSATSRAHPRPC